MASFTHIFFHQHLCQVLSTKQGDTAPTDAKGGYGPTEREPRMCPLEQGRAECIARLSKNLGMYSRIEQEPWGVFPD